MPIGTCKLCLRMGVELQDSHLLPKAGFRRLREDGYAPTVIRDITITKDEQIHDYVFCADCEDRLNKNGETWVLRYCFDDETGFPLGDLVRSVAPIAGDDRMSAYAVAGIPNIDVQKLTYFGISVFWRAAVHDWKTGRDHLNTPKIADEDREAMHLYLMGGTFPPNVVLQVGLLSKPEMLASFSTPDGGLDQGCLWLRFWYLGLKFTIGVGDVPADMRRIAFFPSEENLIAMGSVIDDVLTQGATNRMRESKEIN